MNQQNESQDSTKTLEIDTEDLDPSRNLFNSQDLPVTKVIDITPVRSSAESSPARPDTAIDDDIEPFDEWISISDPHRIGIALEKIKSETPEKLWDILRMTKALASNTAFKLSALESLLGPRLSDFDYLQNDLAIPQHYHTHATIHANLLGLRNQIKNTRKDCLNKNVDLESTCDQLRDNIQAIQYDLEQSKISGPSGNSNMSLQEDQMSDASRPINHFVTRNDASSSANPNAINELNSSVASLKNIVAGWALSGADSKEKVSDLEKQLNSFKSQLDQNVMETSLIRTEVANLTNNRKFDVASIQGLKASVNRIDKEGPSCLKQTGKSEVEARLDLLAGEIQQLKEQLRMDLSSSSMNEWLITKCQAQWETLEFQSKVKNMINRALSNLKVNESNLSNRLKDALIDGLREDIAKETIGAFEANLDRFKSLCQDGMLKEEDLPTTFNMLEAKKSLRLTLSADIKERMKVLSDTVSQVCNQLITILTTDVGLHESEARLMDVVFSSNLLVKFFGGLSGSDEGLGHVIEDLRVWERSAPSTRVETLDALITALKLLQPPIFANQVVNLLKEGLPTRMDTLLGHMEKMAKKDLGDLSKVPVMSWEKFSPKSTMENSISDTTLQNPQPKATSSVLEIGNQDKSTTTRQTLDKLKAKLEKASTSVSKSI